MKKENQERFTEIEKKINTLRFLFWFYLIFLQRYQSRSCILSHVTFDILDCIIFSSIRCFLWVSMSYEHNKWKGWRFGERQLMLMYPIPRKNEKIS